MNQNDPRFSPVPNNYCGGFALDAVLTDLGSRKKTDPKGTYDEIQKIQIEKLLSGSVSAEFIRITMNHDTAMSLPSSIALTAQGKGLNVVVIINEASLTRELGGNTKFIEEEERKLDGRVQNSTSLIAAAERFGASHFIVLVNNAQHWVAVKKEALKKYICYDPGTGRCVTKSTLSEAVGFERMNSLIIALK